MRAGMILLSLCVAGCLAATAATAGERDNRIACQHGDQGQGQRHPERWWRDQNIRKQLGLTKEQQDKIDSIVATERPEMESLLNELRKRQNDLDALLARRDANEATVCSAIDRVEHVRYESSRTHVFMLYRMHRCLTAEQRAALTKIAAERRTPRRW